MTDPQPDRADELVARLRDVMTEDELTTFLQAGIARATEEREMSASTVAVLKADFQAALDPIQTLGAAQALIRGTLTGSAFPLDRELLYSLLMEAVERWCEKHGYPITDVWPNSGAPRRVIELMFGEGDLMGDALRRAIVSRSVLEIRSRSFDSSDWEAEVEGVVATATERFRWPVDQSNQFREDLKRGLAEAEQAPLPALPMPPFQVLTKGEFVWLALRLTPVPLALQIPPPLAQKLGELLLEEATSIPSPPCADEED